MLRFYDHGRKQENFNQEDIDMPVGRHSTAKEVLDGIKNGTYQIENGILDLSFQEGWTEDRFKLLAKLCINKEIVIKQLNLSGCRIGKALGDLLKIPDVEMLLLFDSAFWAGGLNTLADVLRKNETMLTSLVFGSRTEMSFAEASILADALRENKTLAELGIDYIFSTNDAFRAKLIRNTSITEASFVSPNQAVDPRMSEDLQAWLSGNRKRAPRPKPRRRAFKEIRKLSRKIPKERINDLILYVQEGDFTGFDFSGIDEKLPGLVEDEVEYRGGDFTGVSLCGIDLSGEFQTQDNLYCLYDANLSGTDLTGVTLDPLSAHSLCNLTEESSLSLAFKENLEKYVVEQFQKAYREKLETGREADSFSVTFSRFSFFTFKSFNPLAHDLTLQAIVEYANSLNEKADPIIWQLCRGSKPIKFNIPQSIARHNLRDVVEEVKEDIPDDDLLYSNKKGPLVVKNKHQINGDFTQHVALDRGTLFEKCTFLGGTDFSTVEHLRKIKFKQCCLEGLDFFNASEKFNQASFEGSSLRRAKLSGVNLCVTHGNYDDKYYLNGVNLEHAYLNKVVLNMASLHALCAKTKGLSDAFVLNLKKHAVDEFRAAYIAAFKKRNPSLSFMADVRFAGTFDPFRKKNLTFDDLKKYVDSPQGAKSRSRALFYGTSEEGAVTFKIPSIISKENLPQAQKSRERRVASI